MIDSDLSSSARKVQDALTRIGLNCRVMEMPDSTRTAQEAAQAIGCSVGQIVKSLVFKGEKSLKPIMVLASGSNRVDVNRLAEYAGEALMKADPEFVREQTGFAIGGVPPVGFPTPIRTIIDQDLLVYSTIWAAAGTPHAVFELTPQDLVRATGGEVLQIASTQGK